MSSFWATSSAATLMRLCCPFLDVLLLVSHDTVTGRHVLAVHQWAVTSVSSDTKTPQYLKV
jgi:hypothetical protein